MALSNAERQTRHRERKMAEAVARIERYRLARDAALDAVKRIDDGMRISEGFGNEAMRDITTEYREEKEREAKMYEEFAAMWQKDLDRNR